MKKKSILLSTLFLAMAITVITIFVSFIETSQEREIPESSLMQNSSVENKLISSKVNDASNSIGEIVKGKKGEATIQKTFTVNAGYGHLKLDMKNYSSQKVYVSLTHKSSGKLYFSIEIDGKDTVTWKNFENGFEQGVRGGEYILQWSGADHNVNGQFIGKMGSAISDI